jgi:hypothetical protein
MTSKNSVVLCNVHARDMVAKPLQTHSEREEPRDPHEQRDKSCVMCMHGIWGAGAEKEPNGSRIGGHGEAMSYLSDCGWSLLGPFLLFLPIAHVPAGGDEVLRVICIAIVLGTMPSLGRAQRSYRLHRGAGHRCVYSRRQAV